MMSGAAVTILALWLGVIVEILWLFDQRIEHPTTDDPLSPPTVPLNRIRIAIGVLFLGGFLLFGLLNILGLAESSVEDVPLLSELNSLLTALIFVVLPALGLFPRILPKVNEQVILSVHVTVLLGLYLHQEVPVTPLLIIVFAVPTALLLYTALNPRPLPILIKAVCYLWYLIILLVLSLQNDFLTRMLTFPTDPVGAFVYGGNYVFFFLHGFFLLRFALMLLALILPRHRPYLNTTMPQLFSDAQLSRWQLLVITALALLVLALNQWLGLVPNLSLVSTLVLLIVQGAPAPTWERQRRIEDRNRI